MTNFIIKFIYFIKFIYYYYYYFSFLPSSFFSLPHPLSLSWQSLFSLSPVQVVWLSSWEWELLSSDVGVVGRGFHEMGFGMVEYEDGVRKRQPHPRRYKKTPLITVGIRFLVRAFVIWVF